MSLIVPPCSNINATQIQMINSLNKEVAQEGALVLIINHIGNNSERREVYSRMYLDFSEQYFNIYDKCPTSEIGKAALLESIHCEFCATLIDYSAENFSFAERAARRVQNRGQHWKVSNLQDFFEGEALDASLHIGHFGTFNYCCAGYLEFEDLEGNCTRIVAKSAC